MTDTQNFATRMRIQAVQMVHRAKASHIGSALSIATSSPCFTAG